MVRKNNRLRVAATGIFLIVTVLAVLPPAAQSELSASEGLVSPEVGEITTQFTFRLYLINDNFTLPEEVSVFLIDEYLEMEPIAGNISTGLAYEHTEMLPKGEWAFHFRIRTEERTFYYNETPGGLMTVLVYEPFEPTGQDNWLYIGVLVIVIAVSALLLFYLDKKEGLLFFPPKSSEDHSKPHKLPRHENDENHGLEEESEHIEETDDQ